jgi:transketolase
VPGVEQNTGALGHGLSFCVGLALALKQDGSTARVFTLMGDGELAEGSVWEAAMSAAHYRLENLFAIIDRNTLQITGRTTDVMSSEPLPQKFEAFGWSTRIVDGHDPDALTTALSTPSVNGQPTAIIANTIKGKGVSFMEDVGKWHHGVPNDDEYARALAELDQAIARVAGRLS